MKQKRAIYNRLKMAIFSALFFCVFTAKSQKTAQDMNLQGNVRILFIHKYLAKDIVIENNNLVSYEKEKLLHHVEYIFEKNGLLLAENRFNAQDIIELSFIYEYDEHNRLIETTYARGGKILVGRIEYQYNKDGKKTQEIEYDNQDSLKTTTVYQYNTSGNLISAKTYSKANKLIKDIHYQHDERGNVILTNSAKVNMYLSKPYQEVQKFDDRNNLIYKSFTEQDTLRWEYFASYNKNDSLIYEEVRDGEGKQQSYSKLTFKKNKRTSLKQYNSKAEISGFETYYQYDKKGRLLTEKLYISNKKQLFSVRTYYYDEKGNLIYCLEEDKINKVNILHLRRYSYF
jgi:hypothetical protein